MSHLRRFVSGLAAGSGLCLALVVSWRASEAQEDDRSYQVPGDVNGDGAADIADAIALLNYLFAGGPEPAACAVSTRVGLLATGQTTCSDGRWDEIPCDSADYPGQDGAHRLGTPRAPLVEGGDGTVTDPVTGLVWQKTPYPAVPWQEALQYCDALQLAGHDDWRLPNARELFSLVDYGHKDPAAVPGPLLWPGGGSTYWSSTPVSGESGFDVITVNFYRGTISISSRFSPSYLVRAVRGGTPAQR